VERRVALIREVSTLQEDNATLRIQARRMTEEYQRMTRAHADLTRRHEELQQHFQASQSLVVGLQSEQAKLKGEVVVLLAESTQGQTIVAQQKAQRALRQEVTRLEAQIEEEKAEIRRQALRAKSLEDVAARVRRFALLGYFWCLHSAFLSLALM